MPKGFEPLAGLPERLRKKRQFVIFQAYIDDSGSKNDGPLMVVAAVVGPAESWAVVADSWDKELRSSSSQISYFKEDEAVHLAGEFRHWRPEARDKKVQRLARIINRPELFAVWYCLDLDSHRSASSFAGKPYKDAKRHGGNQPYLLLMPTVMMAAGVALNQRHPGAKLELILDEQNVFKDDIQRLYPAMLQAMNTKGLAGIMPSQPWFRNDQEFLPLQAADLVAGTIRRRTLKDPIAMPLDIPRLKVFPNSAVINGADMLKFAQAHTKQRLASTQRPRPKRRR